MNVIQVFTSPRGRIGPLAFLLGIACIAAIEFAVALTRQPNLMLGVALVACVPLFMVFVKRLNDMGAPAWPALVFVACEAVIAWLGFSYVMNPSDNALVAAPWEPDKLLAIRVLGVVGMAFTIAVSAFVLWGLIGPSTNKETAHGPRAAY